jgi:micrococcal nuclease
MLKNISLSVVGIIFFIMILTSFNSDKEVKTIPKNNISRDKIEVLSTTTEKIIESKTPVSKKILYSVVKIIDGDTIDVLINDKVERLRLIGINTPETVDPRKPVECFGKEASNKAREILTDKKVFLESDTSQGDLDKYNRLLRYVFLEDGTNFNLLMIKEGYAYEYTYQTPYKYQLEFKNAQKEATSNKVGLWGDVCQISGTVSVPTTQVNYTNNGTCTIKGNISSTKEKIYHIIGCGSYDKTTIDETKGEKWFCTEQEAIDAGWRKALNCN